MVGGRDKGETRAGDGVARFMAMGWDLDGSDGAWTAGLLAEAMPIRRRRRWARGGRCVLVVVSAAERRRAIFRAEARAVLTFGAGRPVGSVPHRHRGAGAGLNWRGYRWPRGAEQSGEASLSSLDADNNGQGTWRITELGRNIPAGLLGYSGGVLWTKARSGKTLSCWIWNSGCCGVQYDLSGIHMR